MSIRERMKKYLAAKGLSEGKYEKAAGLSNGYVNNIGKSIGSVKLDQIRCASPDLNIDWLLQGRGEMFNDGYDNPNKNVFLTETTNLDSSKVIPIYEIEIDAGNVKRLIDDNNSIPIAGYIYLKDSENSSGLIGVRAKGNSMATFINGGDIMLIRKIDKRSIVPPGEAYVVIGKDVSTVKYIRNGPDNETWTLRSHNDTYEDFVVKKEDIVHLFIVVKVLKELTY